jgi:hypothetical protein
VFQCLVDEGKRKRCIEEFNIPHDIIPDNYNGKISNITIDSQTCTKQDKVPLKENLQSGKSDKIVNKDTNVIAVNETENTGQASVVGTELVLERICASGMLEVKQDNKKNVQEELKSQTLVKSESETGAYSLVQDIAGKGIYRADTGEEGKKLLNQKCEIEMDTEMSCDRSITKVKLESESGMTSDELKSFLYLKQQGMFEVICTNS